MLRHQRLDLRVLDSVGAKGFHVHRNRVRHADAVGQLNFNAVGHAGRHQILGHVASRVGSRAVHLGRILAGERPAAVARHSAVSVHNDLAPGQTGVAHRAADHEPAGRVHQDLGFAVQHVRRDDLFNHHLADIAANYVRADLRVVLGRDDHRVDPRRHPVVIFHRHLRLAVRAQVVHPHPVAAHIRQPFAQAVGQRNRQRHQLFRLQAGIADHHPLVAGARVLDVAGVHALGDVPRLLLHRNNRPAGLVIEAKLRPRVANLAHRVAHDLRHVHVGVRGDLAQHHNQPGRRRRLAGHP